LILRSAVAGLQYRAKLDSFTGVDDLPATFADELTRWGPLRTAAEIPTLAQAQRYCRRLATSHYENFPVVTCLLPRRLHQHFYNIYAYCRWADDLGDEVGDRAKSLELLNWWRRKLAECYAGQPTHPVFVALRPTIREFDIPWTLFADLISAFEQDQRVTEYATFAQLADYCTRSANPVGRLVLFLCRQATEENFRWADSICTGLQLANFWQDVSRDLDMGRVYLPAEDRTRFGYSSDDLHARVTNEAFLELMKFEVDRARQYLNPWSAPSLPELKCLPFRLQVDIESDTVSGTPARSSPNGTRPDCFADASGMRSDGNSDQVLRETSGRP
jgi:squalene synthase HpnC